MNARQEKEENKERKAWKTIKEKGPKRTMMSGFSFSNQREECVFVLCVVHGVIAKAFREG